MVSHFGHRLQFHAEPVTEMPELVRQSLIAHELAHVLQDAEGIRCVEEHADGSAVYVDSDGSYWGGRFEIEYDADQRILDWGYNHYTIDEWLLETGRSKVVTMSPTEYLERLRTVGR